ncbi:MAG: T9SS type A sorting domain-containing protein, partial [Flavobacteriales bacterium]
VNQSICAGSSTTLVGSGATSYSWNNGVTNGVAFVPNATTTYTVTGTAANGCTNTAQVQVTVNALPTVTATASQTVCSGTNVTLNGGGASTYAWNNGVTNGVAFVPNATTTYTVTGTDANGCTNTAQTTVTVNALPTVTAPANQTVCSGTNVTLTGGGASTYAWNNGISNGVAFPANATTTYTVTGTDANGCTNTAQTTVTVNALPTVTAPANQTVCSGTNVTLTGGGASTYAWNNGISNGVAFPANATTTYTVTGTAANGCTNTAQTTVTVNALPTVTAPANQTVCSGTNVTLNGGGASTYAWNNGISNGVAFPANATTTYTVTGTAANGCTNTAQTTVTVNALPTVTAPANQTVCSGTNVTLNGGGASTYAWNNGVSNGVAFPANATTTYTVTGTAANGCTNTAQTTVTVNALPTVTAPANQTVCSGTNVTLSGGGASTYAWNNGITNNVAFPANATTTYTVTGTDANGCTNTAQTTVTVNALPTVTAPANQTVCSGTNVTLTGGGASTYAWNNGVSNGVAFPANATTTYTVTGTDANGCTNTAQTTVTVNALPTVTATTNQTVCSGTNVTLTGGGASTYAWNNGISNGVAFSANATITYTVTGTDANGCTNTAQSTVTVNSLPTVLAASNQAICSGASVTLSGLGAVSYVWDNGVQDGVSFIPNATTTYTVTGTDANGCTNTAQTTVTVNALPTVTATANQTVCSGTNVTLSGGGASTYAWDNGVANNIPFTANNTQTYTVTGTDVNGCTNTAQTTVTVNALPTVTATANQSICSGTSVTLSGSGAISYAWDNGVQDGVVFIPNATTTYTVTGTDLNGCTNTAQTTVTVNALPTVSGGTNQAICSGAAVSLSGSGASSYTWNNNVQDGVAFTPNATQTYTVTGIDNNGCSNVASVTVTVNALPVVSANYPISVCIGTPVVLIGSGALTYAWNNNVQNGIGFIPQSTQVYTVTGTDANGCTDSDQITVTVNTYPTVNAGSNQTVCAGSQVTLNASGAVSYTWNNNVVNGVPFTINSTQTFTVIGSNYGCNDTAQVTVTVNALPAVSAGANQSICSGGSVTLTGSGALSYTWNNNVQNGVAFTPNATTTYTVTGTDANGCTNTAQTTVTVNALPTVNAGANQTVCAGTTATLNGSGAVSYAWDNNVQNGVSFIPNATQTYTVTGTDANGCQGTDQVLVTVASQTTSSITQAACLTYELNGQVYNQSGVYTQTLVNAQGCDSILTLNLTINGLPSIPVVNVGGDNLLSTPAVANTTYQWVFCPSGLSISNQNDTSYLPNVNGSYAVEASNACGTVVSECVIIDNMGIEELTNPLVIYPNPTTNYLNIDGLSTEMISYEVIDVTGRVVLKGLVNQSNHGLEMGSLVTGNYTLRLQGVGSYAIIKQ